MKKRLIDLYPYKIHNSKPQFLILKRASGKIYEGQWRMIGGKVKIDETHWQAALRELREETGVSPVTYWTVPDINHFYDHSSDRILLIPVFAAELSPSAKVQLDEEHEDWRWIHASDAEAYIHWPEQIRLIQLIDKLLTNDQILEDWLIKEF